MRPHLMDPLELDCAQALLGLIQWRGGVWGALPCCVSSCLPGDPSSAVCSPITNTQGALHTPDPQAKPQH